MPSAEPRNHTHTADFACKKCMDCCGCPECIAWFENWVERELPTPHTTINGRGSVARLTQGNKNGLRP